MARPFAWISVKVLTNNQIGANLAAIRTDFRKKANTHLHVNIGNLVIETRTDHLGTGDLLGRHLGRVECLQCFPGLLGLPGGLESLGKS